MLLLQRLVFQPVPGPLFLLLPLAQRVHAQPLLQPPVVRPIVSRLLPPLSYPPIRAPIFLRLRAALPRLERPLLPRLAALPILGAPFLQRPFAPRALAPLRPQRPFQRLTFPLRLLRQHEFRPTLVRQILRRLFVWPLPPLRPLTSRLRQRCERLQRAVSLLLLQLLPPHCAAKDHHPILQPEKPVGLRRSIQQPDCRAVSRGAKASSTAARHFVEDFPPRRHPRMAVDPARARPAFRVLAAHPGLYRHQAHRSRRAAALALRVP